MKFALLIGVTAGVWLVAAGLTAAIGCPQWLPSAVAAGVCLVPAAATMAWVARTEGRPPVESLGSVLIAPIVRIVAVLVLGFVAVLALPPLKAELSALAGWVLGFYLVTLAAETALLLCRACRVSAAVGSGGS